MTPLSSPCFAAVSTRLSMDMLPPAAPATHACTRHVVDQLMGFHGCSLAVHGCSWVRRGSRPREP
eukprot:6229211-Alexandrium_andersonii.AAC.1